RERPPRREPGPDRAFGPGDDGSTRSSAGRRLNRRHRVTRKGCAVNSIAAVRSFNSAEPAWAQACAVIDASGADVAVATTSAGAVFGAESERAIYLDAAAGVVNGVDSSLGYR